MTKIKVQEVETIDYAGDYEFVRLGHKLINKGGRTLPF